MSDECLFQREVVRDAKRKTIVILCVTPDAPRRGMGISMLTHNPEVKPKQYKTVDCRNRLCSQSLASFFWKFSRYSRIAIWVKMTLCGLRLTMICSSRLAVGRKASDRQQATLIRTNQYSKLRSKGWVSPPLLFGQPRNEG
jgi:hypothetical protein